MNRFFGPAFVLVTALSLSACVSAAPEIRAPAAAVSEANLGNQLVAGLEARFQSIISTSGFANLEQLKGGSVAAGGRYREAFELLTNEDLEIAISTTEKVRMPILETGIKGYHEVGDSGGATLSNRNLIEAALLHLTYDQYAGVFPASVKAKYGFLSPKPGSKYDRPRGIFNYGSDRWILKLDRVRSRVTVFPGDSLNKLSSQVNFRDPNDHTMDFQLDDWTGYLIPWSAREILAPMLAQGLESRELGLPVQPLKGTQAEMDDVRASFPPIALEPPRKGKKTLWTSSVINRLKPMPKALSAYTHLASWDLNYFEVQIWGPIAVEDILAFEYTVTPPSEEFLQALKAKGIEIRDGRARAKKGTW